MTLKDTIMADIEKMKAEAQALETEAKTKVQSLRDEAAALEQRLGSLPTEFHNLESWVWTQIKALFGK